MATTFLCRGRPAVAAALHTAERHSAHNDSTACRVRLHIASAATGPIGPFATAAIRPRPTPAADYPPRASHFPGGQRAFACSLVIV